MSDDDPIPPRIMRDARAAFSMATPKGPHKMVVLAWCDESGMESAKTFTRASILRALGARRSSPVEFLIFEDHAAISFVGEFIRRALAADDQPRLDHYLRCTAAIISLGGYIVAATAMAGADPAHN